MKELVFQQFIIEICSEELAKLCFVFCQIVTRQSSNTYAMYSKTLYSIRKHTYAQPNRIEIFGT